MNDIYLNYGAFGLLAFVIFWLTRKLDKKLNQLCNHIKSLEKAIVQLYNKIT